MLAQASLVFYSKSCGAKQSKVSISNSRYNIITLSCRG